MFLVIKKAHIAVRLEYCLEVVSISFVISRMECPITDDATKQETIGLVEEAFYDYHIHHDV